MVTLVCTSRLIVPTLLLLSSVIAGIYREFMRDLCEDTLDKHSHNIHKLVGGWVGGQEACMPWDGLFKRKQQQQQFVDRRLFYSE